MGDLRIRDAEPGDAEAIAALMTELGYPTDPSAAHERLARIARDPGSRALVAERDGAVVGVAAMAVTPLLERDKRSCRLTVLAVAPRARRTGAGRALVDTVAAAATATGCFRLEVTTRPDRPEATAFYKSLGFKPRPERLTRPLSPP